MKISMPTNSRNIYGEIAAKKKKRADQAIIGFEGSRSEKRMSQV